MAARNVDKSGNQPIVKSSDKETPQDSAANTLRGLTDHAGIGSMAAKSNNNVGLSSRQLLPAAVGDSSASPQVEYTPPPDALVGQFAFEVCGTLSEAIQSAELSTTETRQGFRQFMAVVARIPASNPTSTEVYRSTTPRVSRNVNPVMPSLLLRAIMNSEK